MKKFILNTVAIVALILVSVSVKAQPVITEYFTMKEPFKIDLNDKKTQKAVYTRGVLDLDWNDAKRILAVSYDPKLARVEDIVRNIKEVAANNFANGGAAPMSATARNEKE
ncbi:MAG: hypothetical protein JNL70_15845 [Saprospiraceae bacterium]|nr:hypothetical protein [Saprospiraceae bacterium]